MADYVTITHPSPTMADQVITKEHWERLQRHSNMGGWKLKEDVRDQSDKRDYKKAKKSKGNTGGIEAGSED